MRVVADAAGHLAAEVDGYPVDLGQFSTPAVKRAESLRTGLPLASFASATAPLAREMATLVRRLALRGLLEYRLTRGNRDLVIIEPQLADYWPQRAKLRARDVIVLSRFAYLRRRANALVLESPRAPALFQISDPAIASFIGTLAEPRKIADLKQRRGFPGLELIALLCASEIVFTLGAGSKDGLRPSEGDHSLVLWDFHDLLFHTRSTEGRHANTLGGLYPYAGLIPPLPAERPGWPGKQVELSDGFASPTSSPFATLLRARRSVRDFDDANPITLPELAQFLDRSARVLSRWDGPLDPEAGGGPSVGYTSRPYPSAGSAYPLELYLAIANCAGLPRSFYHYDASSHALTAIEVGIPELESMLAAAQFAMDAATLPQVLITMTARFGRLSWKYTAIAYSLILRDAGALLQTFYLTATDMGLGGCAIGTSNIELFAQMTGIPFHVEGPVGVFALGRAANAEASG